MPKLIVLAALLFAAAWPLLAEPVTLPTFPEVLARRFEVVTVDGRTIKLADLTGQGKPVVLEFWATWCGPCRETVPHLVKLQQQYGDRGLVVIGLTLESSASDLTKVRLFTERHGVNYKIAYAPRALYEFMNGGGNVAIPKLFIFDADGKVVQYLTSYSPSTARQIQRGAEQVMRGRTGAPQ